MTQHPTDHGEALLSLLVRRSSFLEALAERPRDKRTLAEDLETSRSTVDRVLRDLMDAGFVRHTEGVYELTLLGRCLLEAFGRYERTIDGVSSAQELLEMLPPDAPIDPVFFAGARVHTPSPEIPDSVIQQLFASVKDSSTFYGIAPVALVGQLRAFTEAANDGGTTVEMLIADELFWKLVDGPDSREVIVDQVERESANIYRGEVPFNFGLWVVDDEAGIAVYTDSGIGGLALNETDEAISWARDLFESLRKDAELVTVSSIDEQSPGETE
ncbi:ArsR family transcriptional regulator [Haloferax sp. MBLA0076]|uniref:ArsR family transcriptional regulator n=1 Tax=Haloferax litoreum TaxID=2666140 RepID=A0A6A8GHI7_9EURY|nr:MULTISPECIES: helix-turn-helix domain-containing protein [Haloferax]KAB1193772.1 ArsR family transcriptional regulator [Haloferax sp. CBA1148]MRX22309.1 ArsR family transcriptional regulator [Haloferax litoreum]